MAQRSTEFGILLTRGIKSISVRENRSIAAVQDELGDQLGVTRWAIEKWRQGHIPGDPDLTLAIAHVCMLRGDVDQAWLRRLLSQAALPLPNNENPPEAIIATREFPRAHNVPRRPFEQLIGRTQELEKLQGFLSTQDRMGVVCIHGVAGVGKTSLALELAQRYLETDQYIAEQDRFQAIVWVTAKHVELLPEGMIKRRPTLTDLEALYQAIADVLEQPQLTQTDDPLRRDIIVARLLSSQRVLLILDSLEEVNDPLLTIFLRDLPAPSKVLITCRHRLPIAIPLPLGVLDHADAHALLRAECEHHQLVLQEDEQRAFISKTGGLPLAIVRVLARMAYYGSSVQTELSQIERGDLYAFCFAPSLRQIRGRPAYALLSALACFPHAADQQAIMAVAGLDSIQDCHEGLRELERLALIMHTDERFTISPLTREWVLAEHRQLSDAGLILRERWIAWYKHFVKQYGSGDALDGWSVKRVAAFDMIQAEWLNLLAVLYWCAEQNRYTDIRDIWQVLNIFAHAYSYWAECMRWHIWLIEAAREHGDVATLANSTHSVGQTYLMMGDFPESTRAFEQVWELREALTPVMRLMLIRDRALLALSTQQKSEADDWIQLYTEQAAQLDVPAKHVTAHQAIIHYYQGLAMMALGEYEQAAHYFYDVLEQIAAFEWPRMNYVIHLQLAYLELQRGAVDKVEQQLQACLESIVDQRGKPMAAFYWHVRALLAHQLHQPHDALHYAQQAYAGYMHVGMQREAEKMLALITNRPSS